MKNAKGKIKNFGFARTVAALLLLLFNFAFLILNCPAAQITIWALPRTNSISDGDLILVARITGGVSNVLSITKGDLLAGATSSALNFDPAQFALINGTNVTIISGASLTNMLAKGSLSSSGPTYTGGLVVTNGVTNLVLTASRALVSDANKGVVSSTVTATELGYLSGVTSALQTQVAALASTANLNSASNFLQGQIGSASTNFPGLIVTNNVNLLARTASTILRTDGGKNIGEVTIGANLTFDGTTLSGSGGAGGSGTNSIFEHTLSGAVSVGASTLFLDRVPIVPQSSAAFIAIGQYTTNCEIRPATTISGNQVSWSGGLDFDHAAGERVTFFAGDASIAWWNARAISSQDDGWKLLQALYTCGISGVRLNLQNASVYTALPLVGPASFRLGYGIIYAHANYPTTSPNAYMLWNQQGTRYRCTADATTNAIITTAAHNLPGAGTATNTIVILYSGPGSTLPAPLANGIPYWVKDYTATTITLKANNTDAAAIDLTTAGTGTNWVYTEVGSMNKMYLDYLTLDAGALPGLNGIYSAMQQPAETKYVRLNNFMGVAWKIVGQQLNMDNTEIIRCGTGLIVTNMTFLYSKSLNIEQYTNGVVGGGHFWGTHFETCLATNNGITWDLSQETETDLLVDGFSGSTAIGPGGVTAHTFFKLSDTNSFAAVDLRRLSFPGGAVNDGLIAISDPRLGPDVHVWNDTNGMSCNRFITHYQHGVRPTSDIYRSEFGGYTFPTLAGGRVQFGAQHLDNPRMIIQSATNQSAGSLEFRHWTGTTNLSIGPAGALSMHRGANQRAGNTNLVGGTVTVANTTVTANTVANLTRKTAGGTLGNLTYTLSAGTSFTINSDSGTDTSTVSYLLLEVP